MEPLIDYLGNSTNEDPCLWNHKTYKAYFQETFWDAHKVGGAVVPWTLKEDKLLKLMRRIFARDVLADMIVEWQTHEPRWTVACEFSKFYSKRNQVYDKVLQAKKGYSWE